MGTIVNGTLKNKESWYWPMFFCTEKKEYEICGYVVYDPKEQTIIGKIDKGWLNDRCKEIPGISLERKRDIDLASPRPYMIADYIKEGIGAGPTYWIYVPIGKFAEMGEQRLVEIKYPNMGLMVQNMAKVTIFGQKTEICLSSELKYYQSFQKRKKICVTTGIIDFDLRKVLEHIKENGYSIDELLEDK